MCGLHGVVRLAHGKGGVGVGGGGGAWRTAPAPLLHLKVHLSHLPTMPPARLQNEWCEAWHIEAMHMVIGVSKTHVKRCVCGF